MKHQAQQLEFLPAGREVIEISLGELADRLAEYERGHRLVHTMTYLPRSRVRLEVSAVPTLGRNQPRSCANVEGAAKGREAA